MSYKKVGWEDAPSSNTPILSASLNQMDDGIEKANKGIVLSYSATFTSDGVLKNTTSTKALGAGSFATSQTDIVTAFVADNVTKINNGAFSGCTSLKTIYVDNTVGNVEIVSGAVPDGVSIVYSNDDNFINVNELLASAIKSLKKQVNADKSDWENRATSIETQHKTDVQALNANISQVADNLQIVKETAQREIATTNTNVNGKESLSNKVDVLTHPSTTTYPSVKGVWDFVETKSEQPRADIAQNKADIVVLKVDKVDNTDFNAYKTSNDTAVKQNATNIANNSALISKSQINVTTDKSTSIVLNDSSDCNIVNLTLYGNSVQSTVPTPNTPADINNVTNPKIKLYHKNLFDFSVCNVNVNDSATINSTDRDNCTISFVTNETGVSSGVYLRHIDLSVFNKGYGVDYTKLGGKPVALSFDIQSDINCKIGIQFIKASYKYFDITSEKQRIVVTDTVDINKLNKAICFYTNKTKANITISNIQIEVNNTATDYEKYNANRVSADCTLCKINNITDTLAVNADGTGYITQNLFYERLTSGKSQSGHSWQYSTVSKRFYRDDTRYKANYGMPNLLCSHFEVKDNERDVTLDNSIGFTSGTGQGVAIRMLQFDGDITSFESWLDSNEVYVLVPLANPIITELSKEQVTEILSLHTYYPSTTVVSDCDSQLTYIADTKNYIDNKILEVATALVAHESEVN